MPQVLAKPTENPIYGAMRVNFGSCNVAPLFKNAAKIANINAKKAEQLS